jgi:LacI family transcriptional regulator
MARGKEERATLDTIAGELGVSKGSVSKALNTRPGVSEELRARVWRAAAESGYAAPTGSGPGRRSSIAVVFDTLANLYSLGMLDGMVDEAQRRGVDVVPEVLSPLSTGPADAPTEQRILDLHARDHDGLIVVTTTIPPALIALCRDLGLPLVSVDSPNSLDADVVSVGSNNWMGGVQATRHLLELGHRRIAFVGGSAGHVGLQGRRAGYRAALEAAGVSEDPRLVSERGMLSAGGPALEMLDLEDPPTAIFAATDPSALDVIRCLTRAGIRIPEDVSVVGYDDTYGTLPAPKLLTTVHTPVPELGGLAVRTVLGLRDGIAPVSHHVDLATSLVVRETTGAPNR